MSGSRPGFLILLSAVCLISSAWADDGPDLADAHAEPHPPVYVRSRPVIERIRLSVIAPVDVEVAATGSILVADSGADLLFSVDADGEAEILADGLKGISRVVDSPQLGIHILQQTGRSGRVLRITDTGVAKQLCYLPFVPAGLGIGPDGSLVTSDSRTGRIIRIDSEGAREVAARVPEPIKDLTVDAVGNAVVLLKSGKLITVFPGSESIRTTGYVPSSATRLRMHPDDFVVALAEDQDGRSVLYRRTDDPDDVQKFAGPPPGTSSFAFDELGNLTLANPDLRAVTRVTSRFMIRCSHCGQQVPMILSPTAPAKRRSF